LKHNQQDVGFDADMALKTSPHWLCREREIHVILSGSPRLRLSRPNGTAFRAKEIAEEVRRESPFGKRILTMLQR